MPNPHRGEISVTLSGQTYTLCLTLGAIAELEVELDAELNGRGLFDLIDDLSAGSIRAADIIKIIGSGMRGGGHDISNADIAAMRIDGGAAGAIDLVARLLRASFAPAQEEKSGDGQISQPMPIAPNPTATDPS